MSRLCVQEINGILQTVETLCEHGSELPCGLEPETYYITTRLACSDFLEAKWEKVSEDERLAIFKDTLEGVGFLHRSGYIHRDITSRNLLVMSRAPDPIYSVVSDFGKMIQAVSSSEKGIGPAYTCAPEVWYSPHYTNAIDIWSLAFAWLATYPPGIPTRQRINEETHAQIVKKVGDLRQAGTICEDFANLLLKMLSWSAGTRISASEALESPVWLKCATVKESDKPKEDVLPNIDNRSSQWLRHAQRVSRIDRKVQAYLCNGLLKRYYLRHMTEKSKRRRRMKRNQRSSTI